MEQAPLREKVYDYLKEELGKGTLLPGSYVDMNLLSQRLEISKTPLRDALIRLESDGIVTIYPRKGVRINPVTMQSVRHIYQICGGLESSLIYTVFDYIAPVHIRKMYEFVEKAEALFLKGDFDDTLDLNWKFHSVYRDLSMNDILKKQLSMFYDRLYHFPRRTFNSPLVKEEEKHYWKEHLDLIELIEKGARREAADFIRDVHWIVKEEYAAQFHLLEQEA